MELEKEETFPTYVLVYKDYYLNMNGSFDKRLYNARLYNNLEDAYNDLKLYTLGTDAQEFAIHKLSTSIVFLNDDFFKSQALKKLTENEKRALGLT